MKKFEQTGDLAVLGASPAFVEPLHVGRPNIGDREAFLARVNDILDRRWLSNNGPMVQDFEKRVAELLGVKHVIAMCNGTIALEIAIRALELKGEVIVPSYTFIATAHALAWQEITPVFADVLPGTHGLDPAAVERMITPRTTGIIGVHLWGHPCDTDGLEELARARGLEIMYDASHAFAVGHRGRMIGSFGRCEVFSFHATKFFNTFEGGAITTDDDELAKKMRLMKNFGFSGFDNVIYPGTNGKMTEICAAMGLTGLDSVDQFMAVNQRNYRSYGERLKGVPGIRLLPFAEDERRNYQYVVIEVGPEYPVPRDALVRLLHAENVLARKYFWPGCHRMLPYREYYPHAGMMLPVTNRVADSVVVLPTGTTIDDTHIDAISGLIRLLAKPGVWATLQGRAQGFCWPIRSLRKKNCATGGSVTWGAAYASPAWLRSTIPRGSE
ncbi:MAG: DegT/DnrJ/EryC1/StrS family aminotransferase [Rhodocyclaceae bacterium]|nr:DegT/DnrJ/EryC1/StrS family aminotransferase [Rhodocyclaceae bacterium]